MPDPTLSLDELRRGARQITERRRDARRDYERYAKEEADADLEYRKTMAKAYTAARADGVTDRGAEILARDAAAEAKQRRDIAASLAKSALLRIEECEREAATLRSIAEWSQRIDGGVA